MKKTFRFLFLLLGWALFAAIFFVIASLGSAEYEHQRSYYIKRELSPEENKIKTVNDEANKLYRDGQWKEFIEFSENHYKNPEFDCRLKYASIYAKGEHSAKDYKKAAEILEFENDSLACALLANLYDLGGHGLEKSPEKSEEYLNKSFAFLGTEKNDYPWSDKEIDANYFMTLAHYIYMGEYPQGFPENKILGWKILQKALPLNPSRLDMAETIYEAEGKSDEFVVLQGEFFDKGNLNIGGDYAEALLFGRNKDEKRGFQVMKKTADYVNSGGINTNAEPWYNIYVAVMYKNGIGTEKNSAEADKYFNKAKIYYEENAKNDAEHKIHTLTIEDVAMLGARIYLGKTRRGNPDFHDKEFGIKLLELSDNLTEKYATKTGNEDLIEAYKRINMPEKVEELYKRYAARSPKFKGEYERWLKSKAHTKE